MNLDMLERVTIFCFAASYGVALALELWHLVRPRPILRLVALGFGCAGLLAHSLYLVFQQIDLAAPFGSLLFLAWVVAVFYVYGSIHHRRLAWGLFVLPVVLGLIVLAVLTPDAGREGEGLLLLSLHGERFWGTLHGLLVLLAAVGICVSFVASVMYLVQVQRLKAKLPPRQGMKMLSLERIEEMNRRGILWAFPLLTAGLVVGIVLQLKHGSPLEGWDSPKVLSVLGLWLVFAILLFLRYAVHVRGRQVAWWTMLAFGLLIMSLAWVHPFVRGGEGP